MDYLSTPPEITSTLIYSGPGSEPMVVASSAWSSLAAELKSIAAQYRSIISQLTSEEWLGPASTAMVTAVTPYVNWMELTAAQAEQAAAQGRAAAAAYEMAHAQTVPPVAVTANRELLQQLVATNILGQNTPSIAATEAEHSEMWAQDTLAMYGYHAQSSAATQLNEFTSPPNPTNPGGDVGTGTAATGTDQAARASTALQNLFRPLSAESTGTPADDILKDPNYLLGKDLIDESVSQVSMHSNNLCAVWRGLSGITGLEKMFADAAKDAAKGASGAASGAASAASGAASGAAKAATGVAGSLGGLSVPPGWAVPPGTGDRAGSGVGRHLAADRRRGRQRNPRQHPDGSPDGDGWNAGGRCGCGRSGLQGVRRAALRKPAHRHAAPPIRRIAPEGTE